MKANRFQITTISLLLASLNGCDPGEPIKKVSHLPSQQANPQPTWLEKKGIIGEYIFSEYQCGTKPVEKGITNAALIADLYQHIPELQDSMKALVTGTTSPVTHANAMLLGKNLISKPDWNNTNPLKEGEPEKNKVDLMGLEIKGSPTSLTFSSLHGSKRRDSDQTWYKPAFFPFLTENTHTHLLSSLSADQVANSSLGRYLSKEASGNVVLTIPADQFQSTEESVCHAKGKPTEDLKLILSPKPAPHSFAAAGLIGTWEITGYRNGDLGTEGTASLHPKAIAIVVMQYLLDASEREKINQWAIALSKGGGTSTEKNAKDLDTGHYQKIYAVVNSIALKTDNSWVVSIGTPFSFTLTITENKAEWKANTTGNKFPKLQQPPGGEVVATWDYEKFKTLLSDHPNPALKGKRLLSQEKSADTREIRFHQDLACKSNTEFPCIGVAENDKQIISVTGAAISTAGHPFCLILKRIKK